MLIILNYINFYIIMQHATLKIFFGNMFLIILKVTDILCDYIYIYIIIIC